MFLDYVSVGVCNGKKSNIFNVDFILKGFDIYIYRYICLNYIFVYIKENIFYICYIREIYKILVEKMINFLKYC